MENNSDITSGKTCRNCNYQLQEDAIYCSKCSQKYTTGKVPVWSFLGEFFSQQLNLDSKLFLTVYALFIPGRLTKEYFKGKHKSYASPLRVFLVTAILLFATISFVIGDAEFDVANEKSDIKYATKREALIKLDSLRQNRAIKFNNKKVSEAYDSLFQDFQYKYAGASLDSVELGNFFGEPDLTWIKLPTEEFAESTPSEIVNKYCNENFSWLDKLLIRQQAKTKKDSKSLIEYFFGKLTLILFLMMPFLALILKLLYIRRDFFYVEHLVFSFHFHAFAFLVTTLLVIFGKQMGGWIAVPIVGIFVYQFLAMRNVYKQKFLKTFLKFWVLFFLYQILAIFFLVLAVGLSLLLF